MRTRTKLKQAAPIPAEVEKPLAGDAPLAEMMDYDYVPYGVKSFTDLQAAEEAAEGAEEVQKLTYQLKRLIENVLGDSDLTPKVAAIQTLMDEFMALVTAALGEVIEPAPEPALDLAAEALAESIDGASDLSLLEETDSAPKGPRDPLIIDAVLIKPGRGNKKDGHYYSADMLKRDAKVFEGVKMYTTDHKAGEKSERTEVSKLERIVGFTEAGAPIGRIVIFDPDFAEKTRNRAKSGTLADLHCSILAHGRVVQGTAPDGERAGIVEAITAAQSVDWVTQAGAGGHAMNLVENGDPMPADVNPEVVVAAPVVVVEVLKEVDPAPVFLSEAEVGELFTARKLAPAVRARLQGGQYATAEKLTEAIESEVAYLKEVTQSGRPFLIESASPPPAPTAQERERHVHQVLAHYR